MYTKKTLLLLMLIMVTCFAASSSAQDAKRMSSPSGKDLSEAQLSQLEIWRNEMEEREFNIYNRSAQKLMDLKLVLRKLSYSSTIEAIKTKSPTILKFAEEIIALDGEMLVNRVEHILKIKKFLTEEKLKELILSVNFELGVMDEHLYIEDLTLSADDLNLSREQAKKYLRNRYEMESKELGLYYSINDKIIDLQQQLFADQIDLSAIKPIISEITAFGNDMMDNRLKTRLALTQKLIHIFRWTNGVVPFWPLGVTL